MGTAQTEDNPSQGKEVGSCLGFPELGAAALFREASCPCSLILTLCELAPGGPYSMLLRTPLVADGECETGWLARSCACTRLTADLRPSFQHAPAKVRAFPKTEVLSTVGTEQRKESLPELLGRTS